MPFFYFDSSSNSLGPPRTLWDSLGPSGTPLGILEGPRGGIKFGVHHIIISSYHHIIISLYQFDGAYRRPMDAIFEVVFYG